MLPQVLVVDDEVGLCLVLKDLLELEGYEVAFCHDIPSACEKLAAGKFDAVLVDVFLTADPVGIELARHILSAYPDTSVILMTGYARKADIDEACLMGAFTCIDKPFSLDDVVRVVGISLDRGCAAQCADRSG